MAQSLRKTDARKSKADDAKARDEALQTRIDRLTLGIYLEGAVAIVAGMIVLSMFLSSGEVPANVWIPAAILGGILAIGIVFTVLARRKARAE